MTRRRLIAGNWKMNKTAAEAVSFIKILSEVSSGMVDVVLCPPFTALSEVSKCLPPFIGLGAQNVHAEPRGAFTGEISVEMLKEWNVRYVIVGHSERRQYFGETNESIGAKVKSLWQGGICPILCVGESLAERRNGQTLTVLGKQLREVLKEHDTSPLEKLVVAYEPIWAIGTGETATPEQAQEVHGFIRHELETCLGKSDTIRILYGGSMNPSNARELLKQPDVDGGLLGGASLVPDTFQAVVRIAEEREPVSDAR
jgi:triosephosphate isomerase